MQYFTASYIADIAIIPAFVDGDPALSKLPALENGINSVFIKLLEKNMSPNTTGLQTLFIVVEFTALLTISQPIPLQDRPM